MSKVIFIVGPTAVGKSDIAVKTAEHINGEIVSCDSMQVYKAIHIASNKLDQTILDHIPHHLIGTIAVTEPYDVVKFNRAARACIKDILHRGAIPIVTGGSGMYVNALLDGIFEDGVRDNDLREKLRKQAEAHGHLFLYDQLKLKDPQAAEKMHPNDVKKVIRALEVSLTLGAPISQLQKQRNGLWGALNIHYFGIDMARSKLYAIINDRVEQMFSRGLVAEIEQFKKQPLSETALRLIGVREVFGYLNGEYDLERAKELVKLNTRHLAKRQWTWFRKDQRITWLNVEPPARVEKIVERIIAQTKGSHDTIRTTSAHRACSCRCC